MGIAGTVESQLANQGKTILEGYRGALYSGMGLSGAGIIVAVLFCRVPKSLASHEKEKLSEIGAAPAAASDATTCMDMTQAQAPEGDLSIVFRC